VDLHACEGNHATPQTIRRALYSHVVQFGLPLEHHRQPNARTRTQSQQTESSCTTATSSEQSDTSNDTWSSASSGLDSVSFLSNEGWSRSRTTSNSSSYIVFASDPISPPRRTIAQNIGLNSVRPRSPLFRVWGPDSESESSLSIISDRDLHAHFHHQTIVAFGNYARSEGIGINVGNAGERLSAITTHYQIPGPAVTFDSELKMWGKVRPNQSPRIGSAAFENRVQYPGGPVTNLDPDMVELQVALTIAHEQSHFRQFEQFPWINLEGMEDHLNSMEANKRTRIIQAQLDQTRIFEFLAYHSEVRNINHYIENNPTLPPEKIDQVNALRDIAIFMRDDFLDQLTSTAKMPILSGNVGKALALIRQKVPNEFICQPTRLTI